MQTFHIFSFLIISSNELIYNKSLHFNEILILIYNPIKL